MRTSLTSFRMVVVLVVLGLAVGVFWADEAMSVPGGIHRYTGGTITFKTAVTNANAVSTTSLAFIAVPASSVSVPIFPGRTALINARYFAEARCTGAAGTWCSLRIQMGPLFGEPFQPADGLDYSFKAAATDNWEGNAMERHLCVRNANTTAIRFLPVIVQWRVSAGGTTFRLDETALAVERSDNCSPVELTIQ